MNGDVRTMPKNVHHVSVNAGGAEYLISNFHGLWFPYDKLDNADRIVQSEKLLSFLNAHNGKKIVCGDFNLMPDTKSIQIIEGGMRNLVKEYNISTTRSSLWEHPQLFADYTFVSSEVVVRDFKVPRITVSDHLPMILEFS